MKLVTKRKGKVVGFVTWVRVGKPKHGLLELTRIEVKHPYLYQGLGTALFKRMLKQIKFRKLFLTTHSSNIRAIQFYMKMGMKEEATLPNHYYKGEGELIFSMFRK